MARQRYFGDRINDLPLILAGPILRQVSETSVTVWLALTQAATLDLQVFKTREGRGEKLEELLFRGQAQTVEIGVALHLCAVTAMTEGALSPEQIYAYDLDITGEGLHVGSLSNLSIEDYGPTGLSYFSHGLPTFATPAQTVEHLKLMHGSCRKPHGGGEDLLCVADHLLMTAANQPHARIQQLYFTGDQIYGDDVADPLLWIATDVGDMLLGWLEDLPLSNMRCEQSFTLPPGVRSDIAKEQAGLTATIGNHDVVASSHLFSLGEYFGAYLLMWSPYLWPLEFPSGKAVQPDIASARQWDQDVRAIKAFITTLPQVRRALANVATYMICDDHDISDDWYLNRDWCQRVLGKPLGYRVVMNGLLAYALCQAWGNTPEQFFSGTTGAKLCRAVEQWSSSAATDMSSERVITQCLGLPERKGDGSQLFCRDDSVDILQRDPQALKWHYRVTSFCHEVLVLDTRTWRGYPDSKAIDPPMLLSPTAFQEQLSEVLQLSPPSQDWDQQLTFVVLPTNLVSLDLIDWVQKKHLESDRVYQHDVGDAWNFNQEAFTQLLITLSKYRRQVIILSGDIHYSCGVQLKIWLDLQAHLQSPNPQPESTTLIQFTCSAIKNAEPATHAVHTKLKSFYREPKEDWLGWKVAPPIEQVIYTEGKLYRHRKNITTDTPYWQETQSFIQGAGNQSIFWKSILPSQAPTPDWRYCSLWIPREPATSVSYQFSSDSQTKPNWITRLKKPFAWIWRNRWMQEGPEVVGHNNIGVIFLEKQQDHSTFNIIQECYWVAPWRQGQVVKSRFSVPLSRPSNIANG